MDINGDSDMKIESQGQAHAPQAHAPQAHAPQAHALGAAKVRECARERPGVEQVDI